MDWLDKEFAFIIWLYKFNNFLGSLRKKDFKEFSTKEEAIRQFEKETGVKYNGHN